MSTELTESALSSACTLHASVGSMNSSTSSLHRRRLGEITEDVEEGGGRGGAVSSGGERPKSGLRHSILSDAESVSKDAKNKLVPTATDSSRLPTSIPISTAPATTSELSRTPTVPTFDKSLPATPTDIRFKVDIKAACEKEGKRAVEGLDLSKAPDPRPSFESRLSAHSTRPSASELDPVNQHTGYTPFKPKVKRGPRPSAQRPHTAGSRTEARPIANLPNTIRISNRPVPSASRPTSSASYRPTSQQSNKSTRSTFVIRRDLAPPPPLPHPSVHISTLYQSPSLYLTNQPASPALSAITSFAPSTTHPGPPGITPEKQRLMRALQLRKKQQMAKAKQIESPTPSLPCAESLQKLDNGSPVTISAPTRTNEHSSKDMAASVSGTDAAHTPASQSQTMTRGIDPVPHTDSSWDGKDVEVISSLGGSVSPTSDATEPSVMSKSVALGRSPLLPPLTHHSIAPMDIPASEMSQDAEPGQNPMIAVNRVTTAEETDRNSKAAGPADSIVPQSESEIPIPTNQESLTQPEPAPSANVDEEAYRSEGQADCPVEEVRPGFPVNIERVDLKSVHPRTRSRGMVESGKAGPSPEPSDISEDESLYDELHTATFEQAKPVTVARSPFGAVLNTGSPDWQRDHKNRTSAWGRETNESTQSTPERSMIGAGRSCTSALPQWSPWVEPAQSLLNTKPNVSSGISKRIRALEIFSGRSDATSPSSPPAPPSPPLTAGLVKKRMSSHSPNETLVRNVSTTTPPGKRLQYPSPDPTPSPAPEIAQQVPSWLHGNGPNAEVYTPKKKGNSISVTARIIREPAESRQNEPSNPSKPAPMNLRRSPLVIEHEKANEAADPLGSNAVDSAAALGMATEPESTPMEMSKSERRRFSLSSNHSNPGRMTHSDSFTKRLSMTIRHSRTESVTLPRSASDASSVTEEKVAKESRKNRLMKRMSVLTAGSRRSIASAFSSNLLRQEEPASLMSQPPESIAEHSGDVSPGPSSITDSQAHVVDIGDVNIQFPDTLLWKRRFMRIDDQGFLILTPPTMETNKRGISRRFHLSDFKKPALPPIEREELPWSIVLDFDDGSCLQCACESRYAQGQVLRSRSPNHFRFSNEADFHL